MESLWLSVIFFWRGRGKGGRCRRERSVSRVPGGMLRPKPKNSRCRSSARHGRRLSWFLRAGCNRAGDGRSCREPRRARGAGACREAIRDQAMSKARRDLRERSPGSEQRNRENLPMFKEKRRQQKKRKKEEMVNQSR